MARSAARIGGLLSAARLAERISGGVQSLLACGAWEVSVIGDFVNYLPGNVQDLSLPGARAAFASPHTVLPNTEDWTFIESIGQETGRYDMDGPLPGRYYGLPWLPPGGVTMQSIGSGIAPNSAYGLTVADVIAAGVPAPTGGGGLFATSATGSTSMLAAPAASAPSPAASVSQAAATGQALGPVTLTTPMPSVLQPRRNQVTPSDLSPCFSQWVADNPALAVGGVVALFLLLRGAK